MEEMQNQIKFNVRTINEKHVLVKTNAKIPMSTLKTTTTWNKIKNQ